MLWHDRKRTFFGLPWSFTIYEFDEERLFINSLKLLKMKLGYIEY